jgi:hypothetical protein
VEVSIPNEKKAPRADIAAVRMEREMVFGIDWKGIDSLNQTGKRPCDESIKCVQTVAKRQSRK